MSTFVRPNEDLFYEPGSEHGLPRDPFKSCVIPRPIGWISTLSATGVPNLAPFSQFQNLTFNPPYVLIISGQKTSGQRKDTIENAERTGEFVWNMATYELREAVNISAQVVGVHIAKEAIRPDGSIDVLPIRPLARLGYYDYTSIESTFQMIIPESSDKPGLLAGLEGAMARFQREMGETVDDPKLTT